MGTNSILFAMFDQKNLPELVKETLNSREPIRVRNAPAHYRHAGVLIPLLVEDDNHHILFTKRSDKVEHHKGQISFPGGAAETNDKSIEETVIRESCEEIGLCEGNVEILGRIDDTVTLESRFVVHPFVGLIYSPHDFVISKVEVEKIITVPWETLIVCNMEKKTCEVERDGVIYETPTYEYNGDLIWGATAKMMDNLLDILKRKSPLLEPEK